MEAHWEEPWSRSDHPMTPRVLVAPWEELRSLVARLVASSHTRIRSLVHRSKVHRSQVHRSLVVEGLSRSPLCLQEVVGNLDWGECSLQIRHQNLPRQTPRQQGHCHLAKPTMLEEEVLSLHTMLEEEVLSLLPHLQEWSLQATKLGGHWQQGS